MTHLLALQCTLSEQLGRHLLDQKGRCVVAESCTGGGLAAAITEIPGSSQWFDRGFVTYSNASKSEMLGVPPALIEKEGAVSEATALFMARGALAVSDATLSVAITGVAGPGGGREDKPVGTVWIAWTTDGLDAQARGYVFLGDRASIRQQAVCKALEGCIKRLKESACQNHLQP